MDQSVTDSPKTMDAELEQAAEVFAELRRRKPEAYEELIQEARASLAAVSESDKAHEVE